MFTVSGKGPEKDQIARTTRNQDVSGSIENAHENYLTINEMTLDINYHSVLCSLDFGHIPF